MFESNRFMTPMRRLRAPMLLSRALILLFLLTSVACDRERAQPTTSPDASPSMLAVQQDVAQPDAASDGASLDALLISSKDDPSLNRTLGDFQHHARQLMLFAPNEVLAKGERAIPDARLRRPMVQSSMLKAMLEEVMIERAARARGIEATFPEIEERIARDPLLARFAVAIPPKPGMLPDTKPGVGDMASTSSSSVKLADLGLAVSDLHEVARHQILREKLEAALANEVDRDQVERSYLQAHDRVRMLWVKISNTPRTDEIDAFLQSEANLASIQDYYASHTRDFRSPAIVVADLLVLPAETRLRDHERVELLKKAREDLAGGLSFEEVATRHELTPRPGQSIVLKEDGRLHAAAIGEAGVSLQAPRGDYVWLVREKLPSKQLELDRSLRREIASIIMRQKAEVPSANAAAMAARDMLSKLSQSRLTIQKDEDAVALAEKLEEELTRGIEGKVRLKVLISDWIERHPDGFLIGIGTSPELMRTIFELDAKGDALATPVTIDQHLWTGVLIGKEKPDMEAFSKDYETFRGQYLDAMKGRMLEVMFPRWQDELGLVLDRAPLTSHYGRVEKKR